MTELARGKAPGRPAPHVTAALYVDLEGVRARYECLLCGTKEGPVFGADDVTAFAATIRTEHPARCSAPREIRK
jgi:hypothetical protein